MPDTRVVDVYRLSNLILIITPGHSYHYCSHFMNEKVRLKVVT